MRAAFVLSPALLLAAAVAVASPSPAPSTSPLLHWHPRTWTPPAQRDCDAPVIAFGAAPARPGIVEGDPPSPAAARAAARAAIRIQTRPDGSRYAIVGGAFRSYMIATFDSDGGMQETCVGSKAEALRRVADLNAKAAATAPTRKEK